MTAGTAVMPSPKQGNVVSFPIGPIGERNSVTFYVGADFPIAGNTSTQPTGIAAAEFYVTISQSDGTGSATGSGLMQADVMRPINVASTSDLNFGTITLPASGSGMVTLDPDKGSVSVEELGVLTLPSSLPTAAAFTVSGEGGQTYSVSLPTTFEMNTSGGAITVTTSHNADGSKGLSGKAGEAGTSQF